MNVKRYLRKQAQEDLKALESEGDREFISQLMETVGERHAPKPKRNKNWLWAIFRYGGMRRGAGRNARSLDGRDKI